MEEEYSVDEIIAAIQDYRAAKENEEQSQQAILFLQRLKEESPIQFIFALFEVMGNRSLEEIIRTTAAIFLYQTMLRRTIEDQNNLIKAWYEADIEARKGFSNICFEATMEPDANLSRNAANLLGLDTCIEFILVPWYKNQEQAAEMQFFSGRLMEIMDAASNSATEEVRCTCFTAIHYFCQNATDLSPGFAMNQFFIQVTEPLFNCIINGMGDSDHPLIQLSAARAMQNALSVFKRQISFPAFLNQLMEMVFAFIQSTVYIEEGSNTTYFCEVGYSLLRNIVDIYYNYLGNYSEDICTQSVQDLESEEEVRQIQACFLWQTIGEVEADIRFPDRHRKRRHEFDASFKLSCDAYETLFGYLVQLIASQHEDETAAQTRVELNTPQNAAFMCFEELSIAADDIALSLIFNFVKDNIQDEDWRLRYTSEMLLNAATQLNSFETQTESILETFDLFVQAIDDRIERITEVAMWSLGRLIARIPELVLDEDRFRMISIAVSTKIGQSDDLTSRACWLFSEIFKVFSAGDESSFLVSTFDEFSSMLLSAVDNIGSDADALDACVGALNHLIERTPGTMEESYYNLFGEVVGRMHPLVESLQRQDEIGVRKLVGYCSFVQAIAMNIGATIQPLANDVTTMLIQCLDNDLIIKDVLPALGAIARAIGPEFGQYLQSFLDKIIDYLQEQENVLSAAVFVSDMYAGMAESFDRETTERFIELLFEGFNIPDISGESRNALYSALNEIAKQLDTECLSWVDRFLEMIERESRAVFPSDSQIPDEEALRSFALTILQVYQTLVPIFGKVERGDRKVRNFFHIFDKLMRNIDFLNEEVLMDAVVLILVVAQTFGRKMNVYTHKPAVIQILNAAANSDNETLVGAAAAAQEEIRNC